MSAPPPAPNPAGARAAVRRRRLRRWLFASVAVVLVAIVVELAGAVGWYLATGSMFSWTKAGLARQQATAGDLAVSVGEGARRAAAARAGAVAGCIVHPYLGYVYDRRSANDRSVSAYGFLDQGSPVRRRSPDRYVVGVVGGSVSVQLCIYAEATLTGALARCPELQGRRIEVVRLGLGGYKQPQQLFAAQLVTMLGGEFDCIVNIDGFNEVALANENVGLGVPAWFPRSWARLLDTVPTPEQQLRLGHIAVLREQRGSAVAWADRLWWSPTAQLVWFLRDRSQAQRLAELAAEAERAAARPTFAVTGPGVASASLAVARREMAGVWRRCSLQLQALCASQGMRYFHFLQPNQYLEHSKPIGSAEAAVAIKPGHPWAEAVRDGYPLLQAEGIALQQAGVAFEDLSGIFREHPEPLYVDTCCHLNQSGYDLLAEEVAGCMRQAIELGGVRIESLRCSPPRLQLDSPLAIEHLVVYGIDSGGGEHDLTGAGFGTRIVPAEADAVAVAGDGSVQARRRGETHLTVHHGALAVDVPVHASWPDVFVATDGRAAAGVPPPQLELEAPLSAAAATVRLRCRDLPVAGLRLLAISPRALPGEVRLGFDLSGVEPVVLDAAAAVPSVSVPLPPAPAPPLFLRAFVLSPDASLVEATSNTVVITRS
ncbi:MAG TPA: hypothetical protein VFZ65_00320 [Planctomycetota bacterium]|nr:hypothetical protein [Planctomycetota bacterium]